MKKTVFFLFLLISIFSLEGCAKKKVVQIQTNPSEANLYVDKSYVGKSPYKTELEFKKEKKKYEVEAKKEGYYPNKIEITYEPKDKTKYLIELKKINKKVVINSQPKGAKVYENENLIGTTPLRKKLYFDKNQTYVFTIKKEGYYPKNIEITYEPKDKTEYSVELEKLSKKVVINSEPEGAEIFLNGNYVGITPLEEKLYFDKNQKYVFIIKKEGYYPAKVTVSYKPKNKTEYIVKLKKLKKEVTIKSEPSNAEVYLNGKYIGLTPLKNTFYFNEKKQYVLELRKDKYEPKKIVIAYNPIDKKEYFVKLKKKEFIDIGLTGYQTVKKEGNLMLIPVYRTYRAYLEIIERSPNVKSVSKITNYADPTLSIGKFSLSYDGKGIIYTLIINEKGKVFSNLWKINIGSLTKSKITSGKWRDITPSYDRDGKYVYFSSNRNSLKLSIWKIRAEGGGGITKITNSLSEDFEPSAGDTYIAYSSNIPNAETTQIWTINKNGSLMTQLKEGHSPSVSPDSNKILFVRKDPYTGKDQIWMMNKDGTGETLLSTNNKVNDKDPSWSADGKYIVFSSDEGVDSTGKHNFDIWIMRADGSGRTQLTTNGSHDDEPVIDSQGKYIYFRSNRGGFWNIWRFEIGLKLKEKKKRIKKKNIDTPEGWIKELGIDENGKK